MWATIQGRKHKALWRRIGRVAWRLVLLWVGYRLYAAYENEPLVETFFSLAVPLAIFFIKEVADVVDAFARIRKAGSFDGKRNRRHILQNAAVAVWYMWLGALTAYGVLFNYPYELWLAFFIALFAPLSRWLPEKIRFQQAQLPYLFRLAEFPSANLSRAEIGALESFLNDSVGSATPRHVVIVGTLGAGKTTLAAGLGTEAAFNQKKVRFLSFDKLQDIVVCGREPVPPRGTEAWKWRESQLLIIDDVLGLQPRAAGTFGGALKSLESVVGCLRQRCTVWVMPSIHSLVEMQDELRAFLQSELLVITLFDGGDLRSVGPSRHHPARAEQT